MCTVFPPSPPRDAFWAVICTPAEIPQGADSQQQLELGGDGRGQAGLLLVRGLDYL